MSSKGCRSENIFCEYSKRPLRVIIKLPGVTGLWEARDDIGEIWKGPEHNSHFDVSRARTALKYIFGKYGRALRGRKRFFEVWNCAGSHKEIFGRSDRILGTAKIGEFKRALGWRGLGARGGREVWMPRDGTYFWTVRRNSRRPEGFWESEMLWASSPKMENWKTNQNDTKNERDVHAPLQRTLLYAVLKCARSPPLYQPVHFPSSLSEKAILTRIFLMVRWSHI